MLQNLFNKYNCDKSSKHKYHLIYERDFEKLRNDPINILEIGIFKGDSIKAWLDYFPNATIFGIDLFTRITPEDIDILNHPRVKWLQGDSTKIEIKEKIMLAWPDITFDIIIDDGLHTPYANRETFNNIFPMCKKNGFYYIEDVWPLDIMTLIQMQHHWLHRDNHTYTLLEWNKFIQTIEKYFVTRYDNRELSGQPDSYIIKVSRKK